MSLVSANPFLLVRQSQATMGGGLSVSAHNPNLRGPDSLGKAFTALESKLGPDTVQAYKNAYKADILAAKPGEVAGRENRDLFLHHLFMTKNLQITESAPLLKALDKVLDKDRRTQDDIKLKKMSTSEYLYEFVGPVAKGVSNLSTQAYDALARFSIFSQSSSQVEARQLRAGRLLYVASQVPEQSTLSLAYYSNTQVGSQTLPIIEPKLQTLIQNNPNIFTEGSTAGTALYDSLTQSQRNLFELMAGQAPDSSNVVTKLTSVLKNSYNVDTNLNKYVANAIVDVLVATNEYRLDTQNKVSTSPGSSDFGPLVPTFANGYTGTLSADSTVKITQGGADTALTGSTSFVLSVSDSAMAINFNSTALPFSVVGRELPCSVSTQEPSKLVVDDIHTSSTVGSYQGFTTSTPGTYVNSGTVDLSTNKAVLSALSTISETTFTCTQPLPSEFGVGKTVTLTGTSSSASLLPSSFSLSSAATSFQNLMAALRVVPDQTVYTNNAGTVLSTLPSDGSTINVYTTAINSAQCSANTVQITHTLMAQGKASPTQAKYDPAQLLYVVTFDSSTNTGTFTINGVTKDITLTDGQSINLYDSAHPADGFGVDGTLTRSGDTFVVAAKATIVDEKTQQLETDMQTQSKTNTILGITSVSGFALILGLCCAVGWLAHKLNTFTTQYEYSRLQNGLATQARLLVEQSDNKRL